MSAERDTRVCQALSGCPGPFATNCTSLTNTQITTCYSDKYKYNYTYKYKYKYK